MPYCFWVVCYHDAVRSQKVSRLCARVSATGKQAGEPDINKRLIEFSHIWMEAALKEERHILDGTRPDVEVQEAETSQLIAQGVHETDDVSNAIQHPYG